MFMQASVTILSTISQGKRYLGLIRSICTTSGPTLQIHSFIDIPCNRYQEHNWNYHKNFVPRKKQTWEARLFFWLERERETLTTNHHLTMSLLITLENVVLPGCGRRNLEHTLVLWQAEPVWCQNSLRNQAIAPS